MGRQNEKTAGQSGTISCNQAREHFYDFADYELSSEDRGNLSHHEESCPFCGPEFKEWHALHRALQNSGITPATDFPAGVIARIRETRQESATRPSAVWEVIRQHGWARGLAAAAVILIMLTGAAKLPAGESLIAHLTGQAYIAFNPQPPATRPATQPPVTTGQVAATGPGSAIAPIKPTTSPAPSSDNGKTPPAQPQTAPKTGGSNGTQVAATGPVVQHPGGFTVSNKPMVITTTTLKLTVNDLAQARSAALNITSSYGASLNYEQSAQDGHSSLLFIHFTVDPATASAFLNRLSSLGGMVSENTTNNDVSGNYNSTLENYNALLAQQAAADDSEKNQYTSQINLLENELQSWSDASGKQVVLLWLSQ